MRYLNAAFAVCYLIGTTCAKEAAASPSISAEFAVAGGHGQNWRESTGVRTSDRSGRQLFTRIGVSSQWPLHPILTLGPKLIAGIFLGGEYDGMGETLAAAVRAEVHPKPQWRLRPVVGIELGPYLSFANQPRSVAIRQHIKPALGFYGALDTGVQFRKPSGFWTFSWTVRALVLGPTQHAHVMYDTRTGETARGISHIAAYGGEFAFGIGHEW